MDEAVSTFGSTVGPLLRAGIGQREANLTFAVEALLRTTAGYLGLNLRAHREAPDRSLGVRFDLAIDVAGASAGVVELKAPGMGVPGSPRWGKARDRQQWEKLTALPNVLYTDGSQWAVYHYGERSGEVATLEGDLAWTGSRLRPLDNRMAEVLQEYLLWKPSPPRDLRDLIRIAARLCHLLRDDVSEALRNEHQAEGESLFSDHLADWQEWLFPDLTDEEFVDAYAQTVTFGLLLARREGVHFDDLELPDIGHRLAKRHLLVGRALTLLTDRPGRGPSIEERSIVLQTMRRVIGVADWEPWHTEGTTYHWLYEEFLEAYDPVLRRQTGAYYTPAAVADFMTRVVDDVLRTHLGIGRGLAAENVVVLDPAMGTGTFLQSVLDRVAGTIGEEGGDIPASLRALLPRLIGFERQIGPYSVAELKLDQALDAHHAEAKDEDFRLYVADTLDDPVSMPIPRRSRTYRPLVDSRISANKVKTDERVMVVLGNPPYRSKAKNYGKWVLAHRPRKRSLLDDFRFPGNGKHEYKLHDLAVYFWRWALWKAFESTVETAGVVAFITTNAYLSGPGFAGMRRYLRQQADLGWIINVSPEGHQADVRTRIFPGVPHPVCIGIFARGSTPHTDQPARIRYLAVGGTQAEKFSRLGSVRLDEVSFLDCPTGWDAPLLPNQAGSWMRHPPVDDLLPYGSPGVKSNRIWVHAPDPDVLRERWRQLIHAEPKFKRALLKETRDRTIDRPMEPSPGGPEILAIRDETRAAPAVERIGFRSFDRQYMITDQRVVDFVRPDLWRIASPRQVYLVTQLRESLSNGPAAVFSAHVPDTHYMHGRGGRVVPLYRDPDARVPNVAPRLLTLLRHRLGLQIGPEDAMAYIAGVIAHSGYTALFRDALRQPGVRAPLTADPALWRDAVTIGKRVIWLHTYGERFSDAASGRLPGQPMAGRPVVLSPIPGGEDDMPDSMTYDASGQTLAVGRGRVGPVSPAVWAYEVSGMRIVKHWFDYRRRNPKGRRGGSPLDEVTAPRWTLDMTEELRNLLAVLEGCAALEASQAELLDRIVTGSLITTTDLERGTIIPPPAGARKALPVDDGQALF